MASDKKRKKRGTAGQRSGPIGTEEDRKAVQATFLDAFLEKAVISYAAQEAGITRTTHYNWLKDCEDYAEAFREAEERVADELEAEARRRAVEGVEEPVGFYMGEHGGTYVRKYSDRLLEFLLKGRRPHVFKERHEVTGDADNPIVHQIKRVVVDPATEEKKEGDG